MPREKTPSWLRNRAPLEVVPIASPKAPGYTPGDSQAHPSIFEISSKITRSSVDAPTPPRFAKHPAVPLAAKLRKCYSNLREPPSAHPAPTPFSGALNSAVECHLHTVEVAGSNPAAPTKIQRSLSIASHLAQSTVLAAGRGFIPGMNSRRITAGLQAAEKLRWGTKTRQGTTSVVP